MIRSTLAGLAGLLIVTASANASDCPVGSSGATGNALQNAKSCAEAVRLLERCSWGNSHDVQFADIVKSKCEDGVPAERRKTYEREKQKCARCTSAQNRWHRRRTATA
ncbi:MAG TPA: hypothetical protein VLI21_10310 [Casimicrobiaceae bacterium]|nr:hypothetical protein [Casimicrobiaceae bacterium]